MVLRARTHRLSLNGPGMDWALCFQVSGRSVGTNCTSPGTTNSWKITMFTHGKFQLMDVTASAIFCTVASASQGTTDI